MEKFHQGSGIFLRRVLKKGAMRKQITPFFKDGYHLYA